MYQDKTSVNNLTSANLRASTALLICPFEPYKDKFFPFKSK